MKIYNVGLECIWPVGCVLIIAAENEEEAMKIAREVSPDLVTGEISEIDISESRVVTYLSGDY